MKSKKLFGLAGSFAICLGTGGFLSAASDPVMNSGQLLRAGLAQTIAPAAGVATTSVSTNTVAAVAAPAQLPPPFPQLPGGGTPPPPAGAPPAPAAAAAAPAAGAAPAAPPRTLWTFLGVPSCDKIHEACAKLKLLLGVPPAPAALGSQEALQSPGAVGAAAKAKAEQDAKPAKIKAIRYLAKLDNACCYKGVPEALLEALKDCDWEVRREAALAFGKACCCDEKIIEALKKIVNDRDEHGNYFEPIDDVRCAAEKSLNLCMCRCPEKYVPPKRETPKPETPAETKEAPGAAARGSVGTAVTSMTGMLLQPTGNSLLVMEDSETEVIELVNSDADPRAASVTRRESSHESRPVAKLVPTKVAVWSPPCQGSVSLVDKKSGLAYATLLEGELPPTGARAQLYHKYPLRTVHVGEVEVVGLTEDDQILIRPAGALTHHQIKKGDKLVVGETN